MHGIIHDKWEELGWETGLLGYPLTDETTTPDGVGRFNHFQNGSIYWSPANGAFEVHGAIRDLWGESGWETGALGYPVSDEYATESGRRSDFEHGYIVYDSASDTATIHLNADEIPDAGPTVIDAGLGGSDGGARRPSRRRHHAGREAARRRWKSG